MNQNITLWTYDDGGRSAAGYKGTAGDCFARALAIAADIPYQQAYDLANDIAKTERTSKRKRGKSSARTGMHACTARRLMGQLGWTWTATMKIGQGCKTHLLCTPSKSELPRGRLIVAVSKHFVAVIDGVIHDTHDPSRDGTRCVYGYWTKET